MNKKGFTLVELITTFALSAVIVILLMNIIVVIKNIYSKTSIKTELYINQSNLSNAMNKVINKDNLESYEECDDEEICYLFKFYNGESTKLIVTDSLVKFGDIVYKLGPKVSVGEVNVSTETIDNVSIDKNDSFLVIKVPINCELYPNIDFGINLVYPYNSNETVL